MTDPVCALCGLPAPGPVWTGDDGVVLHYDGQHSQQIDCKNDNDCTPIFSTCYRAWTFYGLRPYDWEEPA